jgi:hypothetical protein
MPFELDLQHEVLNYTGLFATPVMELWGSGGAIIRALLDALGEHGVTLKQIQIGGGQNSASDTVVTAVVPNVGPVKFAFDKLEFSFTGFTTEFFESIPRLMESLASWLTRVSPVFKFASHSFSYYSHSFVKGSTSKAVLDTLNVRELKSVGISLGNGAI